MGICWDDNRIGMNYALTDLAKKKFTILFLDGNHENFNILDSYAEEEWRGGKIHRLSENVFHLVRGSVFNLEGKKFAVIGGGDSIDKAYRTPQISWWPQEQITQEDIEKMKMELAAVNYKVDYVLSHTCPHSVLDKYFRLLCDGTDKLHTKSEFMLDELLDLNFSFSHWLFGHFHKNIMLDDKFVCFYDRIREV